MASEVHPDWISRERWMSKVLCEQQKSHSQCEQEKSYSQQQKSQEKSHSQCEQEKSHSQQQKSRRERRWEEKCQWDQKRRLRWATEVRYQKYRWEQKSRLKWSSQNMLRESSEQWNGRNIGESSEQWKSRLESKWDSILHRNGPNIGESSEQWKSRLESDSIIHRSTRMLDLKAPCVIEVFEDEFRSIISSDNWEVFLYLTSYLLGLEYNIDHPVIWLWISQHDAVKIADVIMIKDLPITLESTQPFLYSAAWSHSFRVVEFFLSASLYGVSQVEYCLDIALLSAWDTLEKVTSVVCWKKSPEEAINCFKLIATLCLPQMKPALSTLDRIARFMCHELLAKEACNRAKQGRFLDYALLLMVAPLKVLDFIRMRSFLDGGSFLDGLRSEMSLSEWPVVFRTCIFLTDIFSSVKYDFCELWQLSEGLTQQEIVHQVYSICKRAGLYVRFKDIKLRDAHTHTLCPQPKLSDSDFDLRMGPTTFPRFHLDIQKNINIYPKSFECKWFSTVSFLPIEAVPH